MDIDRGRLSVNDQLVILLGEIQVADVILEDDIRSLWLALAGDGFVNHLIPSDFARLIDDCKVRLQASALEEDVRELGRKVLLEVHESHRKRNTLAHDRWIAAETEEVSWRSGAEARRIGLASGRPPRVVR